MEINDINQDRLSDRILYALDMAINQKDIDMSEKLVTALELSMTRGVGGKEFIERRDYPPYIEDSLCRYDELRKKAS